MRFPLSLTTTMVGYLARKKLARERRFPLVLMLEPLHACNLTCTGCGRIREYATTIKDKLTVAECLKAVDEAGSPIVSICGGEPMIYPQIGQLVRKILQRRRHVILCTNGMFTRKRLPEFRPTPRFCFNVHLDGLEQTHDRAVERPGVFREAVEGIKAAKAAGRELARGVNASPGAAVGKAIFDADRAEEAGKRGERVILVRQETSPDDVHGMLVARGILTSRGGTGSHAAVVARGLGLPAVVGCEALRVDYERREAQVRGEPADGGQTLPHLELAGLDRRGDLRDELLGRRGGRGRIEGDDHLRSSLPLTPLRRQPRPAASRCAGSGSLAACRNRSRP